MIWSRDIDVEGFVVPSTSQCSESEAVQTLAYISEMRTTGKKKLKQPEMKKTNPYQPVFPLCIYAD